SAAPRETPLQFQSKILSVSRTQRIKDQSRRVVEVLRWRAKKLYRREKIILRDGDAALTFLIAHFNAPEFLEVCLHAIRKFHAGSRIVVADATSDWKTYRAAKKVCAQFSAEMH